MYLVDSDGEIIYHPRQNLLNTNMLEESNQVAASHQDGSYTERYDGEERVIIVKTVGYTGWKVVSVTPVSEYTSSTIQVRFFAVMLIVFFMLVLLMVNSLSLIHIWNIIQMRFLS